MQDININKIFEQVISDMTGGLIPDLTTLFLAMLSLLLIFVGFTILKDILLDRVESFVRNQKEESVYANAMAGAITSYNDAARYRGMRDSAESGSMDYEYYNSLYRSRLQESIKLTPEGESVVHPPADPSLPSYLGTPSSSNQSLFFGEEKHYESGFDALLVAGPVSPSTAGSAASSYRGEESSSWLDYPDDPGPQRW